MPVIKFPQQPRKDPLFKEIVEEGYHVFSLKNAKKADFYPNEFPDYPGVRLTDLKPDDIITIRVFFKVGSGKNVRADGGYIDLEVEHVEEDRVWAAILTELPDGFALETGSSIEVFEEEILYKREKTEH